MSAFSYKAADMNGKVVKGVLDAADEKGAVLRLQDMGYIPIRIDAGGRTSGMLDKDVRTIAGPLFSGAARRDVLRFTQDLHALLRAGLPVDRSISILIDTFSKASFRSVLRDLLKSVQGGSDLSGAIAKYPRVFSDFYVNMVRAGEAGGVLEPVLERLGMFLETSQELKDYVKSALVYPIFLVLVGGISIIILMTFVVPRFSMIFADMGGAIPLSTRLLLDASLLMKSYGWTLFPAGLAAYVGFVQYRRTPAGRKKVDGVKLKLPMIGEVIRQMAVARFARTLGTLIKSGVPILKAMELVRDIVGNRVISDRLDAVRTRLKEGDRLSLPLQQAGIFPPLAVQMITVGEESGKLDEMLLRIAETYEKIVRNLIKRAIGLIEPVMILFMGVVVGFIVISMLLAIFSMNEMPI